MDDDPRKVERVLATVEAVLAAYEAGSPGFFDFFTGDATVFSLSHPTRIEGGEDYRRASGASFQEPRRAVRTLHPEVRLVGEGALVTLHLRLRINYRFLDNRVTFLLVPEGEGLKVAHMHMSPLAASAPSETRGLVEDVTLLPVRR